MKHLLLSASTLLLLAGCGQKAINLVPQPVQITAQQGQFVITHNTPLVLQNMDASSATALYIQEFLSSRLGLHLPSGSDDAAQALRFILNPTPDAALPAEGYTLQANANGISIVANTDAGLVYGLQTLYQLAPAQISTQHVDAIAIPAVDITDYPRFEWRGSHLDVSRHFFDVEYVKKHLDVMALYKLNKFHWHLTDDHGWRLQIDKYPKLTEIGAWRVDRSKETWLSNIPPKEGEPATYGGFYTKEQVKEVLAYAAARNIEVIPEIEIPGHCSEVLASYPEFACDTFPYIVEVGPYWPPKAIMCGGNDKVITFFNDIMDEVIELFPSQYIHIGGDEAEKGNWKACAKCQARIKKLKLNNEEELQSWMIREVEKHVAAKNKRIIGWDEILEGGVTPNAVLMYWRGWVKDSVLIDAIRKQGNQVIMTPNTYCYIDYYQTLPQQATQVAIGGYLPIEKVYAFEPIPTGLSADEAHFIKGGQANLWAEFLFESTNVEYMLLPRLLALAEAVWSPKEARNWARFEQQLPNQKKRLSALGYNYCNEVGLIKDAPKE